MRKYFVIIITFFLSSIIYAQDELTLDSIGIFNINLSSYNTTNGKMYLANGKAVSKEKFDFYKSNWENGSKCKPCKLYTYREDGSIQNISIQYDGCMLGKYHAFTSNGKLETEGQFTTNPDNDWSNLRSRGLCSVREGEWKYYNENGNLLYIESYSNGTLIHKQDFQNESNPNEEKGIRRLKGIFNRDKSEE